MKKIFNTLIITTLLIISASTYHTSLAATAGHRFSAFGLVANVNDTSVSVNEANGSDGSKNSSYTFEISNLTKIQNNKSVAISISDLKLGDKIGLQGRELDGTLNASRVVLFSVASIVSTTTIPVAEASITASTSVSVSTSTATSTGGVPSIDLTASVIQATTSDTTTPSIISPTSTTSDTTTPQVAPTTTPDATVVTPITPTETPVEVAPVVPVEVPAPDVAPAPASDTSPSL